MKFEKLKHVYLLGIGGIGMSALARYFKQKGLSVSGFDKTATSLTGDLQKEDIHIHFIDSVENINSEIKQADKNEVLIIYTPAIPKDSDELNYFRNNNYKLYKRSEVLGLITENTFTIAVAGTHGKTTTSTLVAHLLKTGGLNVSAFLGGISKNYNSNILFSTGKGRELTVVEADEYDRSFLNLSPDIAIITSTDADHLDIYGKHEQLKESFDLFANKVKAGGTLIVKTNLDVNVPTHARTFYYSRNSGGNFYAEELANEGLVQKFNAFTPDKELTDLVLGMPGLHNIENAIAAIAVAFTLDIPYEKIKEGLATFSGVQRRFDIRVNHEKVLYIDDYAHHPAELRACIGAVRNLFPDKNILGIFQPHLFSRTRDFMDEFADALEMLDKVMLMEIYPARELPIDGVSSSVLLEKISIENKQLVTADAVVEKAIDGDCDIILTLGAGDIDLIVNPLEKRLKHKFQTVC